MPTMQNEDRTILYDDSLEIKNQVFKVCLDWFCEHDAFEGDTVAQSDSCQIDAQDLLQTLINIYKFDVKFKKES